MDSKEQSKELLRKALEQTELQEHAGDLADILDAFVEARLWQILRGAFNLSPIESQVFYTLPNISPYEVLHISQDDAKEESK